MEHVDTVRIYLAEPDSAAKSSASDRVDDRSVVAALDSLAVLLRTEDERAALGSSDLPELLARLLRGSVGKHDVVLQIGRVAANLAVDNGFVGAAIDAFCAPQGPADSLPTARALAASLLNMVVDGHAPTVTALVSAETVDRLVPVANRLRGALALPEVEDGTAETRLEIVKWLWTVIEAAVDERPLELARLSALVGPLGANVLAGVPDDDAADLAPLDLAILASCARVLERACLAGPAALADAPQVDTMLDFAEGSTAAEASARAAGDEDDVKLAEAARVAVRHAVVELLSESRAARLEPRVLGWLERDYALAATAMLIYGNWVRDDLSAQALLPVLLPRLQRWLVPTTPMLAQHALVGLLRNLAIPPANKALIGGAGVIEALAAMGVWAERTDVAGSVQGGAVGVVKNLCFNNPDNALRFLACAPAVDQIRALISRTDDAAIRFEATRIIVNATRSVAAAPDAAAAAWPTLADDWALAALATMIRAGKEHAVLVGEGVAALALLATFAGAKDRVASECTRVEGGTAAVDVLGPLLGDDGASEQLRANVATLARALKGTAAEAALAA